VEQAEKAVRVSERIKNWSTRLGAEGAKLGAREVAKDLTAPLWVEVAQRIADLYHSIMAWLSAL
jgi:hypothetical protein